MDRFKSLNNEYYKIEVSINQIGKDAWRASGRITRRDTGEVCTLGGNRADGKSREEALDKLYGQFARNVEKLGIPYDWNKPDRARLLVNDYIKYKRKLIGKLIQLEDQLKDNTLTEEMLKEYHHALVDYVTSNVCYFSNKVFEFEEKELLRIVECKEDVYQNGGRHLDEIYAKEELFGLIKNPSDLVVEAHKRHHDKMFSPLE